MTLSIALSLLVALVGSGGIMFGALRFNREEAGRVVAQQTEILSDMRQLYELTRAERDTLRDEVARLKRRIDTLETSLERGRGTLRRQISALHDRIEDLSEHADIPPDLAERIHRMAEEIAAIEEACRA